VLAVEGVVRGEVVRATAGGSSYLGRKLFDHELVEFQGLVGSVELCGGDDVLAGGADDDELVGDHELRVAAAVAGPLFAAEAGVAAPGTSNSWWSQREVPVEFHGLVDCIELNAGHDSLAGDEGNDRLAGDSDILVAATLQGALVSGFAAPTSGNTNYAPSIDLVRVNGIVGSLDAEAGCDLLAGGAGNDLLLGDNALHLAAVIAGGGEAAGSSLAPYFKLGVEVGSLVDDVELDASSDQLLGGEGHDELIGDQALDAAVILTGEQPADGVRVNVRSFMHDMQIDAGNDLLDGGMGDDRLTGDSKMNVAGVRLQDGAGSRALEINSLVCDLDAEAGCDVLLGGEGDDTLTGDQELVIAGVVADGGVAGAVTVTIHELVDSITLDAGEDSLDGGAGSDVLVGDHVAAIVALADARSTLEVGPSTGSLVLTIDELVDRVELKAGEDELYGGAGDDLAVGDSQSLISALHGAFSSAVAAVVQLAGGQLVDNYDVRADRDKLRGGDGDDQLVGDSDTTVAGPASGLARLIDQLAVSAASDDAKGEAGTNGVENGNRAATPSGLVKHASVSSRGAGAPAAPKIDWNGRLGEDAPPAAGASSWLEDFANRLGRSDEDPNSRIRIKL
jgi:Ca2+-binding RTX toxin-like protein